jgi:hypothetical protein
MGAPNRTNDLQVGKRDQQVDEVIVQAVKVHRWVTGLHPAETAAWAARCGTRREWVAP